MRLVCVGLMFVAAAVLVGSSLGKKQKPKYSPSPHVAETDPRTPEDERKGFHLPPGFRVELIAAEPEIRKPINIAFDARGRLWVTQSVEYPFPAKQGTMARDCVKVLDDFGPDGRARKVTTFADGLNIPIGVLPQNDGAIVYSIPNVYRLTDTTGAGKADRRQVLLGLYGHNDTHGMTGEFTQGFDGWVYACHGFSNTSHIKAADGSHITMHSGNTYRFKPDGSHVEYFTHGQVNPFGLAWDPLGNLYSCDCHSRPIYQLLRGAYYLSFGKPHDGLGFGPEMLHHDHGSTAIAGITYLAADNFPAAFRDNILIGNVVTNRINRDRLETHGSSYRAIEMPDFLSSDDPWFRPVDIKLGPDGALYVADFYNRIIGHYEVPLTHEGRDRERGRIWRISYHGADAKNTPAPRKDFTRAAAADLVKNLAHPNLTVRLLATNELAGRKEKGVAAAVRAGMGSGSNPWQRMHGLWVLQRRGVLDDKTLAAATRDEDRGVRVHAMRILEQRQPFPEDLHKLAVAGLKDGDPLVRRCAAQALGSHPAAANVRPLLELRHNIPADDTHLLFVVRMALRDQLVPAATWKELQSEKWSDRDARAIADVCNGAPTPEAAAYLLRHIRHYAETGGTLDTYVHHVARYGTKETVKHLLEFARASRPTVLLHQRGMFRAFQQGTQERGAPLSKEARAWGEALTNQLLASPRNQEFMAGVELAGTLQVKGLRDLLLGIVDSRGAILDRRIAAVNALAAIDPRGAVAVLGKTVAASGQPLGLREHAAGVLGRINQPAAHAELLKALPLVPARVQHVIAVELARSPQGAEKLLEAVAAGKASARLLQDRLVDLRLKETRLPDRAKRVAKLTTGLPPADQKIQDLLRRRHDRFLKAQADAGRGAKVFEQHCANCHQIANKGARIGPQLDGIGIRGVDRILEDVLDPNRNVDQAFRLTTLTLTDGRIVSGLQLREEGAVIVLADNKGKEVRIPKNEVDTKAVSQISPMPADFAVQIKEKEFYDLVAYLLAQKAPAAKP